MKSELDNLFEDFSDGDAPTPELATLEKRIDKIENAIAILVKEVANAKKGKPYPYPEGYPKPGEEPEKKKKEEEEMGKELALIKDSLAKKETELAGISAKLAEYESKDKSDKVNELVNAELDKSLYSKEQAIEIAKEYQKLDFATIAVLKSRLATIDLSKSEKKTEKAQEFSTAADAEKEAKIKDLTMRIEARKEGHLKYADLSKELAELTKTEAI